MTKYSKFNVIYRLQKWMDSVPGQTFLNYAYSWGASVVIERILLFIDRFFTIVRTFARRIAKNNVTL